MTGWTLRDMPSQAGRRVIVTGTGGLGYESALALAGAGAHVVLAGRDEAKGAASVAQIKAAYPQAKITFEALDLARLASVADFAARMRASKDGLDLLINNAGVMSPPERRETADGFELQFGTNHLGHFALTAQLLPLLRAGRAARVVNVSSGVAYRGVMNFDDLNQTQTYAGWSGYGQSKLANLLFTLEFQRRSDARGWGLMTNAAHPGYALTELIPNGPGRNPVSSLLATFAAQSPADGALPQLFAATAPGALPIHFYGPKGLMGLKGPPGVVDLPPRALSADDARRLWEISETLTGARFPA